MALFSKKKKRPEKQPTEEVRVADKKEAVKDERRSKKGKSEKKEKKQTKIKSDKIKIKNKPSIPKTMQDSIPYTKVYEKGIIEIEDGVFSKSYRLPDANFRTATVERQRQIVENWGEFLGAFPADATLEITVHNKSVDIEKFKRGVLLEPQMDEFNEYRDEYNEMLLDKMAASKNNLESDKYLTVSLAASNIIEAADAFSNVDATVSEQLAHIVNQDVTPMGTVDRLSVLNNIYNPDSPPLYEKRTIDGHEVESFTLENCARQGITTKEAIAPAGLKITGNLIEMGDVYARTYYIADYPTWIKASLLTAFEELPTNMITSVYFDAFQQEKAYKLIKGQSTNIRSMLVDRQKSAGRSGYDPSLISPELNDAKADAKELQDDMTKENARLFNTNVVFTIFGKSKEELDKYQKELYSIGHKFLLTIRPMNNQQEEAFNTSLPLGNNKLEIGRLMTTNSVSGIIPFNVLECRNPEGFYYGLNAVSHNMILYDRTSNLNPCGCILGVPGGGKSFASKREMVNVILNTDDEIYVIDPEAEYGVLAEQLGGSVVKIANGGTNYINPFDLNIKNTGDDSDPIRVAVDYISTICEIAIGGKYGLSPIDLSIVNRCTTNIYQDYIQYLTQTGKDIDTEHAPTMEDFYDELLIQPEEEARTIALALERFVSGSCDIFSHHTNVDINNRFTVFDIKDIGSGLKEMGLQIALNHVWNQMIQNRDKGKRTWLYIDEFYLLMARKTSAAYISEIWKRARKWNGIPTAITQNVEDMLNSNEARTVINNSSFVCMLAQSPLNRQQLSKLFSISAEEQKYISRSKAGMGLLRLGDSLIPMDDSFPKDTKLYKIMSTKPGESLKDE